MTKVHAVMVLAVVGVLALSGCGSSDDAEGGSAPTRLSVIVDTDAGLDDAIALLYLAASPDIDLRAVTVSGTGLAHCFPGARNVVGLLELAGRTGVPVSCGPEAPLGGGGAFHPFPDSWRRFADTRYGDAWRIGRGPLDERQAPDLLVETVNGSETNVTLVTLGPLTNVAAALALDRGFGSGVERIVVMGGAFDVDGNTANAEPPPDRNVAEWNMYADPEAARDVVHAGLPLTFVPLDATNGVPFDAYVLRAVALAPETRIIGVVRTLLVGLQPMIAGGDYYLWDPLAAVLARRPELGTVEQRAIDVVANGSEAGRTITTRAGTDGWPAGVFTAADGRAAEAELLQVLAGEPLALIDEHPDLVIDASTCTTSGGDVTAGPRVLHVDAASARTRGIAIGTLAPGRSVADIEALFAEPVTQAPDWFTPAAALGGGVEAPLTDLARFEPGEYAVVCFELDSTGLTLTGTTTFTVLL